MKNLEISVLDLAPLKEDKSYNDTFKDSLDLARHAENLNYKRFWLAEHHNMKNIASSATSVLIGYIANGTEKIRVGSGGVMLPNHSSLIIAEQFGTLDSLFPNRIDLGLGRAPGTDALTAQALGRHISNINDSFSQQLYELENYFSTENETLVHAYPGEGANVPMYILGSSTDSAWLAAELGLPYAFAGHFAPEKMQIAFEIYKDNFKPSQRNPEPYAIASVNGCGAETDEEAQHLVTTLQQAFLGIIRNDRKPYAPPVDDMDALWSIDEKALITQKLALTFVGSKNTVKQQIIDFKSKYKADELLINSHIFDHEARKKSYTIIREAVDEINNNQ